MAPTPVRHPLRDDEDAQRRRAIAAHPAGTAHVAVRPDHPEAPRTAQPAPSRLAQPAPSRDRVPVAAAEDGSMTTEYGLIIVVGATVCSVVIQWASGGAVFDLLGGVLNAAKGLVGF